MKGSTLHRSGLTREKMGVLASLTNSDKKQHGTRAQLNQYYRAAKNQELDLLWSGAQRGIQKVQGSTRNASVQKSPAAFLMIGFIAGVLFMSCITLIVSISSMAPREAKAPKAPKEAKVKQLDTTKDKSNVAVIGEDASAQAPVEGLVTHEKYVVKKGDTLNGIAYRFYGRYNEAKIQEIQRINNITNPGALSIGQELTIPVSQDR